MNKFSLRFKLLSVVGLLSICCLAIAGWGLFEMDKAQDRLNFIVKTVSVRLGQWTEIRDYQRVLSLRERDLLMADTPEERKKAEKQLETYKSRIDETIKQYLPIALDEGKAKAGEFSEYLNAWWATNLKVRELLDRGDREAAEALVRGIGLDNRNKALAVQEALVEMNQNIMAAEVKSADAEHTRASTIMLVFAIAAAVSASVIGILIVRQITRTIEAVIASLQENSNQVSVASQQIASASENLSQASTEQAASLQETAATMAEVSSMVARNTESASRTSDVSSTSQSTAQRGQRVVEDMTKAISEINRSNDEIVAAVAESNRQMGEITRVIGEIGEKTKVINDIVFQTKLLSFNASVEAARAGEHGKGFSVVAEEVGNLAAMSGNAAKEISGMLESSVQTVNSIAERTKQNVDRLVQVGKQKVDTGMRIAEECSAVLSEIVGSVTEVAQMSGDISQASREQATGVEEINKAMGELDKVTQINASAAEEASASARALSSQAETLKANVVALIEAIRGADDAEKPASPVKSPKVEKAVKSKPATQLKVVGGSAGGSKAVSAASKTKIKASEPKSAAVPLKQVAGGDFKVPTEDDPRFSDI